MSQRLLAKQAGCTQSHLAKVERGKAVPSYLLAGRIFHILETEEHRSEKTVSDIMHAPVFFFDVSETVADAAKLAKAKDVDQFPILRRGHIAGSVTTADMMGVKDSVPLGRIMGPGLPSVPPATPISAVAPLLREAPAVVVLDEGKIVGIVSASDFLGVRLPSV
jgi:predicted transcriptional regulator